jgi:hypothetical protein
MNEYIYRQRLRREKVSSTGELGAADLKNRLTRPLHPMPSHPIPPPIQFSHAVSPSAALCFRKCSWFPQCIFNPQSGKKRRQTLAAAIRAHSQSLPFPEPPGKKREASRSAQNPGTNPLLSFLYLSRFISLMHKSRFRNATHAKAQLNCGRHTPLILTSTKIPSTSSR